MDRTELGRQLNLFEEFIPLHMQNRPGTLITPTSITLHNTSNTARGANADRHSKFVRETGYYMWNGRKNWVSWHYTVDDAKVIKQLPLNEVAYHAGRTANKSSIAIETCMNRDIDQPAADARLAKLVAALLYDFGWNTDKVVSHQHWTGKNCPILLLADWNGIITMISDALADLRAGGRSADPLTGATPEFEPLAEPLVAAEPVEDFDIDHDRLGTALDTMP